MRLGQTCLCLLLVAFVFTPLGRADSAGWKEADTLFEDGLFQEALRAYEKIAEGAVGEEQSRALYRVLESEVLLFRYGEALARFEKLELPADPLWKARFLILKSELYRQFLKQYGYYVPRDVVEGEEDVTRKTPEQMQEEIASAFEELWGLKTWLAQRSLREERAFIAFDNASLGHYPTLWDFVVLQWSDYLMRELSPPAESEEPAATDFFPEHFAYKLERGRMAKDAPILVAGALMEEAAALEGGRRGEAREQWLIKRVKLPLHYPHRVTWSENRRKDYDAGIRTLLRWQEAFEYPEAKAEAGATAAWFYYQTDRLQQALDTCAVVRKRFRKTAGAGRCEQVEAKVKRPALYLSVENNPPLGHVPHLTSRNLKSVFFRLYETTPSELLQIQQRRYRESWSQVLAYQEREVLEAFLQGKKPSRSWDEKAKVADKTLYDSATWEVRLPKLGRGVYLLVASSDKRFRIGEDLISGVVFNRTNLMLVGTAGLKATESEMLYTPDGPKEKTLQAFHFYLLDAESGKPVGGAGLDVMLNVQGRGWQTRKLKTDGEGRGGVSVPVSLHPQSHNYAYADPLAEKEGAYAYWQKYAYLSFSVPQAIRVYIDTDRPIYRPGQKVRLKVTVLQRIPQGYRAYQGSAKVSLRVSDPNTQEVFALEEEPNDMGSLSAEFEIPTGRLLGTYRVQASITDWEGAYSGYRPFAVEEYKRPEFEVKLKEAKEPWKVGEEAEVEGEVAYYFGAPVPGADLTAVVTREPYIPSYAWWWAYPYGKTDRQEVLRTQLKSDEEGRFRLKFTPKLHDPDADLPSRFRVEVEARDAGGRTMTTSQTYVAGKRAYLFRIDPPAGFFWSGETVEIPTQLMNLNDQPVAGSASYQLYRIEQPPGDSERGHSYGGFPESPSLDLMYKEAENAARVAQGTLAYDGKTPAAAALPPLPAGVYRLALKASDPWGGRVEQATTLAVVDRTSGKLPAPISALALPEQSKVQAGETAKVLIGSHKLEEPLHVEIWGGPFLLKRDRFQAGGIRVYEIPVTEDHKGGFTVRWFGVRRHEMLAGTASLDVPYTEKKLTATLDFEKQLRPGQEASWTLRVKDQQGRPVDGEALLTMFDRSLEFYARYGSLWPGGLYGRRPGPGEGRASLTTPSAASIGVEKGWVKKMLDLYHAAIAEVEPPMLRLARSRIDTRTEKKGKGAMPPTTGALLEALAPEPGVREAKRRAQHEEAIAGKGDEALPPPAELRSDFSETAFFQPQLAIKEGQGRFSFKAPEQLTGWRILGYVVTKDLKTDLLSEEAVTKKELMVRVELPRFYREGDEGTIKAVVHNETDAEARGTLALSALKDEKPADRSLGLKNLERAFAVKPRGIQAFAWQVAIPDLSTAQAGGRGIYTIRAVARAGQLSDAEERAVPVLPSRQRLIESVVVPLNDTVTKTLKIPAFSEPDPTRENESLQLQIDPQLALTILNSIPFLVQYPFECVEQTLNRFVPLGIIFEIYRKYPNVARAVEKIPRRDTITPAWDRSDPRRIMQLMETPWEDVSKGINSFRPVVDLLDPRIVERQREEALADLRAAQLSSGAFPWFPGGRPDPYITLVVLEGFAQAKKYGVAIPDEVVRKALRYVLSEIPKELMPKTSNLSLILYAAYVVTQYPKDYPGNERGFQFAKVWADYADKYAHALTPFGRAYAAYVYWKLGEKEKGDLYLKRAMDGAREDPTAGVYWAPEKQAWLWYNDTVEKHAFLLKALQEMKPDDPRLPGMVQWLIFNRKGNAWKSTKASAAAVYALLDFMQAKGALDHADRFTVAWGDIRETVEVLPDAWLDRPIAWRKEGDALAETYAAPKIVKEGPGFAFASLTWIYTTRKLAGASAPGLMNVERRFYRRVKQADAFHLKPLSSGDTVEVGDQIEVQLRITTSSQFEYVHLKDPKASGFEAEALRSGWRWDQIGRYEEPRDSLTNFFMDWVPHGEYVLRYRLRPTLPGRFRLGAAVMQSMYAPEFSAHSAGFEVVVAE